MYKTLRLLRLPLAGQRDIAHAPMRAQARPGWLASIAGGASSRPYAHHKHAHRTTHVSVVSAARRRITYLQRCGEYDLSRRYGRNALDLVRGYATQRTRSPEATPISGGGRVASPCVLCIKSGQLASAVAGRMSVRTLTKRQSRPLSKGRCKSTKAGSKSRSRSKSVKFIMKPKNKKVTGKQISIEECCRYCDRRVRHALDELAFAVACKARELAECGGGYEEKGAKSAKSKAGSCHSVKKKSSARLGSNKSTQSMQRRMSSTKSVRKKSSKSIACKKSKSKSSCKKKSSKSVKKKSSAKLAKKSSKSSCKKKSSKSLGKKSSKSVCKKSSVALCSKKSKKVGKKASTSSIRKSKSLPCVTKHTTWQVLPPNQNVRSHSVGSTRHSSSSCEPKGKGKICSKRNTKHLCKKRPAKKGGKRASKKKSSDGSIESKSSQASKCSKKSAKKKSSAKLCEKKSSKGSVGSKKSKCSVGSKKSAKSAAKKCSSGSVASKKSTKSSKSVKSVKSTKSAKSSAASIKACGKSEKKVCKDKHPKDKKEDPGKLKEDPCKAKKSKPALKAKKSVKGMKGDKSDGQSCNKSDYSLGQNEYCVLPPGGKGQGGLGIGGKPKDMCPPIPCNANVKKCPATRGEMVAICEAAHKNKGKIDIKSSIDVCKAKFKKAQAKAKEMKLVKLEGKKLKSKDDMTCNTPKRPPQKGKKMEKPKKIEKDNCRTIIKPKKQKQECAGLAPERSGMNLPGKSVSTKMILKPSTSTSSLIKTMSTDRISTATENTRRERKESEDFLVLNHDKLSKKQEDIYLRIPSFAKNMKPSNAQMPGQKTSQLPDGYYEPSLSMGSIASQQVSEKFKQFADNLSMRVGSKPSSGDNLTISSADSRRVIQRSVPVEIITASTVPLKRKPSKLIYEKVETDSIDANRDDESVASKDLWKKGSRSIPMTIVSTTSFPSGEYALLATPDDTVSTTSSKQLSARKRNLQGQTSKQLSEDDQHPGLIYEMADTNLDTASTSSSVPSKQASSKHSSKEESTPLFVPGEALVPSRVKATSREEMNVDEPKLKIKPTGDMHSLEDIWSKDGKKYMAMTQPAPTKSIKRTMLDAGEWATEEVRPMTTPLQTETLECGSEVLIRTNGQCHKTVLNVPVEAEKIVLEIDLKNAHEGPMVTKITTTPNRAVELEQKRDPVEMMTEDIRKLTMSNKVSVKPPARPVSEIKLYTLQSCKGSHLPHEMQTELLKYIKSMKGEKPNTLVFQAKAIGRNDDGVSLRSINFKPKKRYLHSEGVRCNPSTMDLFKKGQNAFVQTRANMSTEDDCDCECRHRKVTSLRKPLVWTGSKPCRDLRDKTFEDLFPSGKPRRRGPEVFQSPEPTCRTQAMPMFGACCQPVPMEVTTFAQTLDDYLYPSKKDTFYAQLYRKPLPIDECPTDLDFVDPPSRISRAALKRAANQRLASQMVEQARTRERCLQKMKEEELCDLKNPQSVVHEKINFGQLAQCNKVKLAVIKARAERECFEELALKWNHQARLRRRRQVKRLQPRYTELPRGKLPTFKDPNAPALTAPGVEIIPNYDYNYQANAEGPKARREWSAKIKRTMKLLADQQDPTVQGYRDVTQRELCLTHEKCMKKSKKMLVGDTVRNKPDQICSLMPKDDKEEQKKGGKPPFIGASVIPYSIPSFSGEFRLVPWKQELRDSFVLNCEFVVLDRLVSRIECVLNNMILHGGKSAVSQEAIVRTENTTENVGQSKTEEGLPSVESEKKPEVETSKQTMINTIAGYLVRIFPGSKAGSKDSTKKFQALEVESGFETHCVLAKSALELIQSELEECDQLLRHLDKAIETLSTKVSSLGSVADTQHQQNFNTMMRIQLDLLKKARDSLDRHIKSTEERLLTRAKFDRNQVRGAGKQHVKASKRHWTPLLDRIIRESERVGNIAEIKQLKKDVQQVHALVFGKLRNINLPDALRKLEQVALDAASPLPDVKEKVKELKEQLTKMKELAASTADGRIGPNREETLLELKKAAEAKKQELQKLLQDLQQKEDEVKKGKK